MNDAQINENVNNKEPYTHIRYIVDKEPITFVEPLVQWFARVFRAFAIQIFYTHIARIM